MPCTTGCRTRDHESYGECLRSLGVGQWMARPSLGFDRDVQRRWDGELESYRRARKEGIQPDGTTQPKIDAARRASDAAGAAYGRDFNVATPMED